jgi:hypothetical protein
MGLMSAAAEYLLPESLFDRIPTRKEVSDHAQYLFDTAQY